VRSQDKANLVNSYTNRERALGKTSKQVVVKPLVKITRANEVVNTAVRVAPVSNVLGRSKLVQNHESSTKFFGEKNGPQPGRHYRVARSFLRRIRRFRNEGRRNFAQTKVAKFNRTKSLISRAKLNTLSSRSVSRPLSKKGLNEKAVGLTTLGSQTIRTPYQSQTQPAGLQAAVRVLTLFTGSTVSVHRINGLALARLGLDRDKIALQTADKAIVVTKSSKPQGANSGRLLAHLRETTGTRLGTSPTAVPDLVRLPFTALYIKAAPALAERLAQGLRTLPRQRKETAFLRSLRKLVKVLAALRPERLGLRIRLQGRVNR